LLSRLICYIKGYLRIRIAGYSTERFLNACRHRGIYLWGLQAVSGAYEMNISISGFRKLKPIIRKTGTKVSIVERFGTSTLREISPARTRRCWNFWRRSP